MALEWISPGGRVVRDAFGNLVLLFERDELAAGETFEIGWRARVRLQAGAHEVDPTRARLDRSRSRRTSLVRYLADGEPYQLSTTRTCTAAAEAARARRLATRSTSRSA